MNFVQEIFARMIRNRQPDQDGLILKGSFIAEHIRNGLKIGEYCGNNGITVVGKNLILDTMFGNSTPVAQIDPWYIGLIDNSPAPVLVEADTLASHAGWTELTAYAGTRKAWDDANAASKVKGTNAAAIFTFNATKTVYGLMIASVTSGTSGILWSTGAFSTGPADFVNNDVLNVTYSLRC